MKAIGFVSDSVGSVKLSDSEKHRWQELAGQASYDRRKALIESREYQSLSWGEKAKALDKAVEAGREDAALKLGLEFAQTSTTDEGTAKGALIAIHSRDDIAGQADVVVRLQEAGRLTPAVRDAINQSWGTTYEVRPKGTVVDGDTIRLEDPPGLPRVPGQRDTYRLLRVDTPEKTEKGYAAARAALETIIAGAQKIEIRTKKTDTFGRYLVELIADGVNVSDRLVEQGHAKYNKPSKDDPVSVDDMLRIAGLVSEYKASGPQRRAVIQKDPLYPLFKEAVATPKPGGTPSVTPPPAPLPTPRPSGTPPPVSAPTGSEVPKGHWSTR